MLKKKKDKTPPSLLTEEQEEQLQNMVNGMLDIASDLVEEYGDADLDDLEMLSGSITQIHETSPFLNEILKGDSWKRVISHIKPKENKKDDTE